MTNTLPRSAGQVSYSGSFRGLARFVAFLYVDLWVIEGAFRKWVPGADQLFYVARDAFAIGAVVVLIVLGRSRPRYTGWFWTWLVVLAILGSLQTLANDHALEVFIAGLRSYVSPLLLLLICLMPPTSGAAVAIGRRVLIWVPVQFALTLIQVASSPADWINAQPSGDVTQFVSDGVPRASGTFSSPAGYVAYMTIAFAIALAFAATKGGRGRPWYALLVAAVALCAVLSGSRALIINITLVLIMFSIYALARGQSRTFGLLILTIGAVAAVLIAARALFGGVVDAFLQRFDDASRAEDSGGRVLRQALGFLSYPPSGFGDGMGVHSQAGIALGSGFAWIEIETIKWVAELGLLGLVLASVVMLTCLYTTSRAMVRVRTAPLLHTLMVAVAVPVLISGHVTQTPSSQAASAVMIALVALTWRDEAGNDPGEGDALRDAALAR
jgi:hypothetical protein